MIAFVVLGLAMLWAPFAPFVSPKPSRVWKGYQTVVLRAGSASDLGAPAAISLLGRGVVTASTATVDFYDFSSVARYPYAALAKRLDPMDPRRDPYLDGMGAYFTVPSGDADYHVLYVPAQTTSVSLFLRLWQLFGPPKKGGWFLADFDPLEKILSVIAPLAFSVLFALGAGRRRRGWPLLAFASSLLWLPSVLAGGPSTLAFSLINLSFSLPFLRVRFLTPGDWRAEILRVAAPLRRYLGASAASLLLLAILQGPGPALALALPPVLCTLLLAWLVPAFSRFVDVRRRARVFSPVPLVRSIHEPARGGQRALMLALFAIALVALAPLLRDVAFPAPVPAKGSHGFSWSSLALFRKASRHGLPDIADFVAHEAFQQTLGIGGTWKEPVVPDERVYRQEYTVDPVSGSVRAGLRMVKSLDATWLASVMSHPAPGSLEALLLAQGRPVTVTVRGPARTLAGELPFVALAFAALVVLLARDLGAGLLIRTNLWRINGEARRDQIS